MHKITAPNPNYSGSIGNVCFEKGQAQTCDLKVLRYCREAGYKVELIEASSTKKKKTAKRDSE